MAADKRFASVSDKKNVVALVGLQLPGRKTSTRGEFWDQIPGDATGEKSFSSFQSDPAWMRRLQPVTEYRPLDFFSNAADCDPALLSEADEICELSLRLKEIELCEMMEETPRFTEKKCSRNIQTILKKDQVPHYSGNVNPYTWHRPRGRVDPMLWSPSAPTLRPFVHQPGPARNTGFQYCEEKQMWIQIHKNELD